MPLSLEKSLQDEGQDHLRVFKHVRRILFRALWKYVRLTHLRMPGGRPKDGRMGGSIWMGEEATWKEEKKIMGSWENSV